MGEHRVPPPRIASGAPHACSGCGRTCTAEESVPKPHLTPLRRRLADVGAEVLAVTMATIGNYQQWADRLGLARQVVARFAAPGGPRVTVGDILALPDEVALSYLAALQQRIRGAMHSNTPAPSLDALDRKVGIATGELTREVDNALADDVITPEEAGRIAQRAEAVAETAELVAEAAMVGHAPHLRRVP